MTKQICERTRRKISEQKKNIVRQRVLHSLGRNLLAIKVDRPQLSEEDIKKLETSGATAVDGQPIHHMQRGPH